MRDVIEQQQRFSCLRTDDAEKVLDMKTKDVTVELPYVQAEGKARSVAAKGTTRLGARKGRRKYEYEALQGNEFNSDGRMMRKERIIDRRNDRYRETVVDEDSGEVVRQIDESLSEHRNRGSASFKKTGDPNKSMERDAEPPPKK